MAVNSTPIMHNSSLVIPYFTVKHGCKSSAVLFLISSYSHMIILSSCVLREQRCVTCNCMLLHLKLGSCSCMSLKPLEFYGHSVGYSALLDPCGGAGDAHTQL